MRGFTHESLESGVPYELVWERRGLYRRYFGDLTLAERSESLHRIVGDERFDSLRYVITDYSEVAGFEDKPEATSESASMHVGPMLTNGSLVAAAVATRPDILASLNAFKALAEATLRYEVFPSVQEARRWIESGDAVARVPGRLHR